MTYDFHDRLVRTDYASGRTDVYDYGQNTVTETKKGITVSKTFDAVGRVIRVSDMAEVYNILASRWSARIDYSAG